MKTRIISGIAMAIIVAGILALGMIVNPIFITIFIAAVAAIAVYELLKNAAGIKNFGVVAVSCVYTILMTIAQDSGVANWAARLLRLSTSPKRLAYYDAFLKAPYILTVLYFVFAVAVILHYHKDFDLGKIFALTAMPLFLAYAFNSLGSIINHDQGIYYLLLLLNFSSMCDMGAYFVGVTLGKHKLCPEISPKKTVEGAIGGIVTSIIFAAILVFSFGYTNHVLATLLLTIPLCILGMMGDLFASSIKRSAGIKDYGNLIPGHGGILDRFDSILLISPLLYMLIDLKVI